MPRAARDFSPIYTTEQVTLSFDFTFALAVGETLLTQVSPLSPTVSIAVITGIDATPSARLIGTPSVIGALVVKMFGTLQPNTTYNAIATVYTSAGQILTVNAHISCPLID
jgi:hypothetical protein